MRQGRIHVARVTLSVRHAGDGEMEVVAPRPGWWVQGPLLGEVLGPGAFLGWLQVLGARIELRVPSGVRGRVVARAGGERPPAIVPVDHGCVLLRLRPMFAESAEEQTSRSHDASVRGEGISLCSPGSGRFYRRPAPDAPPFVSEGDVVEAGAPLGLLEIMKTFHRIDYEPDPTLGLPERGRIVAVLVEDGEDVQSGMPLFRLVPC